MEELTKAQIESYLRSIETYKADFKEVLNNYRNNVTKINSGLDEITFKNWSDDIATSLSTHKTSLKNGLVGKMNDSIAEYGSLKKLEVLFEQLETACNKYLNNFADSTVDESALGANSPGKRQMAIIIDLLDQISKLRFDSDVTFEEIPSIEPQTVVINQFDVVKVMMDGTVRNMYYLGTNYEGKSYFSETLDDNATAYVAVWPSGLGETDADINHWADKYKDNPLVYQSMIESQALFAITGGNTGTLTKGNVLKKIFGAYANGQYVGDANFNNSIIFENSYYAPEVVQRGSNSFDASNAYHVVNLENSNYVSLATVLQSGSGFTSDYHPDVLLKPGERIDTKYGWWIFGTDCYIGSNTESVLLRWDDETNNYYAVKGNGYYTASRNDAVDYGFRRISIDQLNNSDTRFTVQE